MIRSILKITCLMFAWAMGAYIFAMAQHEDHHEYIGTAKAQDGNEAVANAENIQPQTQNGVTYITGGIGDEERELIKAQKGEYNLHLTLSSRDGDYDSANILTINSGSGTVLPATDAGPLFYASLEPGIYHVTAVRNGATKQMTVVIGRSKPVYLTLSL